MTTPQQYDYIVVGSGIAGLYTALMAQEHGTVLLLTKGSVEDCNTQFAQGGIAAALGKEDSPELHMRDTLAAGAGLCDPEVVRILATDGPQAIADLVRLGVNFDTSHGETALAREGAHSVPRVLHAGGDSTGQHIELTLSSLAHSSRVRVMEFAEVTRIIINTAKNRAVGVEVLDRRSGQWNSFHGQWIVLATGGAGRLFRYTTNPAVATGDGAALAFRAGAAVMDMEFYQFHPTALRLDGAPPFLISEAVRGEGATLRNVQGEAFMQRHHAQGDLAPRDVVSRALLTEMQSTSSDHVLLDLTDLSASHIATRFPTIYHTCLEHGLEISRDAIPVAPAAHYMMGGIQTNIWGETSLAGLYACGETACTGVHGANRLASNSLLETVVFGRRLVQRSQMKASPQDPHGLPIEDGVPQFMNPARTQAVPTLSNLQNLMWEKVGMVRDESTLKEAVGILITWAKNLENSRDRGGRELGNMVLLAQLMAQAALLRRESRGAHFRTDYSGTSSAWQRHIVFQRENGWPELEPK
jgi:L-aspartate oxidase